MFEQLLHRQTGGHKYYCARIHQSRCRRNPHDRIRCAYSLCTFHSYVWPQAQQMASSFCTSIMILHWRKSLFSWSVEVVQLRQGSGLVMNWKQSAKMLVGGHQDVGCPGLHRSFSLLPHVCCRIWKTMAPVMSISSGSSSRTLLAGFADGVIKVDKCLEDDGSIVWTYADHTSWI